MRPRHGLPGVGQETGQLIFKPLEVELGPAAGCFRGCHFDWGFLVVWSSVNSQVCMCAVFSEAPLPVALTSLSPPQGYFFMAQMLFKLCGSL